MIFRIPIVRSRSPRCRDVARIFAAVFLCLTLAASWSTATARSSPLAPVLVLGDSLSAAHNIDKNAGWVALLASRLGQAVPPRGVVNASISGETSAGGLARLPALLQRERPALVVLELGANDGLRGLPLAALRGNLESMISASRNSGARVLLMEMDLPVNYGPTYREAFRSLYRELADKYAIPLVPFFLDTVWRDPSLMQDDGLHPNAAAQARLLDVVWPHLERDLAPQRQPK